MSVLVTGAHGQVGKEIVALLSSRGVSVIAAGHAECDITSLDSIRRIIKSKNIVRIINAAAYTAVDKAEEESDLAMMINAEGSKHLALAASEAGISLLHISTDYIFDGQTQSPYREDAVSNPLNLYGKSKLVGENYIKDHMSDYIILRTSWVFGRHGNNFVKTMLRLGKERKELRIVDDQYGCPTSAVDIATAVCEISDRLDDGHAKFGIYHYCGTPATTWCGFAKEIFSAASEFDFPSPSVTPIQTSDYTLPASRPMYSVLDCEKIKTDYGILQPDWKVSLKTVVREIFRVQQS